MSKIEWTEETWNFLRGCSLVSAGCKNCYAMKMAWRLSHNPLSKKYYQGLTEKTEGGNIRWTGKINIDQERILLPMKRDKPTTFFVNSMSDLFHEDVPFKIIDQAMVVMVLCQQHTFQVLTKRPALMMDYFQLGSDLANRIHNAVNSLGFSNPDQTEKLFWSIYMKGFPVKNIWLGVSVENQGCADNRMEALKGISNLGWTTWVSNEPTLGPIDWTGWEFINWMVTGGESGPGARPMHPDWARASRDFCTANNIPFFFKQWGAYRPLRPGQTGEPYKPQNHVIVENGFIGSCEMVMVGKKGAGRMLDGSLWDEYPVRK